MTTVVEFPSSEQAQDDLIIQRQLAEAIHRSLAALTYEALTDEMALLLVRLAVAQLLRQASDDRELERATPLSRRDAALPD